MAYYGVDRDVRVKDMNIKLKNQMRNLGKGVRRLAEVFTAFDVDQSGKLTNAEFEDALRAFGLFPTKLELQGLFNFYDRNGDGCISYQEFLLGLREEFSSRKRSIIEKVWKNLDSNRSGEISGKDILDRLDMTQHPKVQSGECT